MNDSAKAGFKYLVETFNKDGDLIDSEVVENIIPTEGLNYLVGVSVSNTAKLNNWYIGLNSGNYTPVAGDTAATYPSNATEFTNYVGATRLAFTPGTVSGGTVDNTAAKAEFEFSDTTTVYGGFMTSASGNGATSGVLISAVKFSSPKQPGAGGILRVTAGLSIASA